MYRVQCPFEVSWGEDPIPEIWLNNTSEARLESVDNSSLPATAVSGRQVDCGIGGVIDARFSCQELCTGEFQMSGYWFKLRLGQQEASRKPFFGHL
jgi:hypothetical protein